MARMEAVLALRRIQFEVRQTLPTPESHQPRHPSECQGSLPVAELWISAESRV